MKVPNALRTSEARLVLGSAALLVGFGIGMFAASTLFQMVKRVSSSVSESRAAKIQAEAKQALDAVTARLGVAWTGEPINGFGISYTNTLLITNLGPGSASNLVMRSAGTASLGDGRTLNGLLGPGGTLAVPWVWNPPSTGNVCLEAVLTWYPDNAVTSRVCINVSLPDLDLSVQGSREIAFGTTAENRLVVRNAGSVPAHGVKVIGVLSGNARWTRWPEPSGTNLPVLMPGQSLPLPFDLEMLTDRAGPIGAVFTVSAGNTRVGTASADWNAEWHDLRPALDPLVKNSNTGIHWADCRITNVGPADLGAFEVQIIDGPLSGLPLKLPGISAGGHAAFRVTTEAVRADWKLVLRIVMPSGYRREWPMPVVAVSPSSKEPAATPVLAKTNRPTEKPDRVESFAGHFPDPTYPKEARLRRIRGEVRLRILVNAAGRASEVKIVESSGYGILDQEAKRVVKNEWQWPPGNPETVDKTIEFKLVDNR